MATCAVIGQGVGAAVVQCSIKNKYPKKLEKSEIRQIQQQLLKDDCYIPGIINDDDSDALKNADVLVSSESPLIFPNDLVKGYEYEPHRQKTLSRSNLDVPRAQLFPCNNNFIEKIEVYLKSENRNTTKLKATLIKASNIHELNIEKNLKSINLEIDPDYSDWMELKFNCKIEDKTYIWLNLESEKDVYWLYSKSSPTGIVSSSRIIDKHRPQKGSYAIKIYPQIYPYNRHSAVVEGKNLIIHD